MACYCGHNLHHIFVIVHESIHSLSYNTTCYRSIFKGSICLLFTQIPPVYNEAWSAFLSRGGGGGGLLPYKRLMGMSRWMGSLLHD